MISSERGNIAIFPIASRISVYLQLRHILLMVLLVVISSLATIYLKYRMQERFLELNRLNAAWHHMHEQSDRLSLERQTLLSRSSVLSKAHALGMAHHQ